MLQSISITNYILIRNLHIDFSAGLSVITGETGAGKSILIGALSLLMGKRMDTDILLDKSRKCILEACFGISAYSLESFFSKHDLDFSDQLILRREFTPVGKSRAFVNDTPVGLSMLKDLGQFIIDIHSQHTTITLNRSSVQLAMLDHFAKNRDLLEEYRTHYTYFLKLKADFERLSEQQEQARNDQDYFSFILDELESAELESAVKQQIEEKLGTLQHAEDLKKSLLTASEKLNQSDMNIIDELYGIYQDIQSLAQFHSKFEDFSNRLNSIQLELKDINDEMLKLEESIEYDPEEIQIFTERMNELNRLQQKHKVNTVQDLVGVREQFKEKLSSINHLKDQLDEIENKLNDQQSGLDLLSHQLHERRLAAIPEILKELKRRMELLGLPDAFIGIEVEVVENYSSTGKDKAKVLFAANKGGTPEEIGKVISGGELSRLMLSIKSTIAEKNVLPTIILDEIDSGISGEVAAKMGSILKDMASSMQVIVITHLPQIAGKGDVHLNISKQTDDQSTYSEITQLSAEDRVIEIAKMLSNEQLTPAAMETARHLLNIQSKTLSN
jgi:DNA repair protein RecN (Recombination protein N)